MIDLSGQIFGRWTILRRSENKSSNRQILWICRCECGKEYERTGASLRNGDSKGCKNCCYKDRERTAIVGQYYYTKRHAEIRKIGFYISIDEYKNLLEKQNYKCALTDLPINWAKSRRDYMHGGSTASLDRIDSNDDYTIDNVQWVHKDVNRMKWTLSQEEFIEICRLVMIKNKK